MNSDLTSDSKVKIYGDGPIMVIDDDKDFLALITEVFEESVVANPLVLSSSGSEGIQYLEESLKGEKPKPVLVLLDINMPGMDGFQTLKKIRAIQEFKQIPVVTMLSSSDDERDITKSKEHGADDYKVKPFGFDEFVALINSLAE